MEKINNYTPVKFKITRVEPLCSPEPDFIDNPDLGFVATLKTNINQMSIDVWGHSLSKEETKSVAKLIALAPTLYERYFKMLEALNGSLTRRLKAMGLLSEFQSYLEQTIKDCEL